MNRPKFRAWDKQEGKWYEPIYEAYRGNLFEMLLSLRGDILLRELAAGESVMNHESLPQYKDRYIIMQSTGLLDKNGREVYEGDYVGTDDEYGDYIAWCDECVSFQVVWRDTGGEVICHSCDGDFQLSELNRDGVLAEILGWVIGNIYEHSNLLQNTNEDN